MLTAQFQTIHWGVSTGKQISIDLTEGEVQANVEGKYHFLNCHVGFFQIVISNWKQLLMDILKLFYYCSLYIFQSDFHLSW